jgi:hypothetical protein
MIRRSVSNTVCSTVLTRNCQTERKRAKGGKGAVFIPGRSQVMRPGELHGTECSNTVYTRLRLVVQTDG